LTLRFELVGKRDLQPDLQPSPVCDLLVASARLCLLQVYRRRKQDLISGRRSVNPPSILKPLSQIAQYQMTSRRALLDLESLRTTVAHAGLTARLVQRHSAADVLDIGVLEDVLADGALADHLGVLLSLQVEGCIGLSTSITAPATMIVTTSRAEFPLDDPTDLPRILASDLALQLLSFVSQALVEAADEQVRGRIILDELENVIMIVSGGIIRLEIPAPFAEITGTLYGPIASLGIVQYRSSDRPLLDWVREVAERLPDLIKG